VSAETLSLDMTSLFHSVIDVLSEVIDSHSGTGSSSLCVLAPRDPYRPLWDCAVTVYCNSLLGKIISEELSRLIVDT